ncbi:hypothetical protein O4J56_25495, partial [Nocardiopsis sp. RSe5-2]
ECCHSGGFDSTFVEIIAGEGRTGPTDAAVAPGALGHPPEPPPPGQTAGRARKPPRSLRRRDRR